MKLGTETGSLINHLMSNNSTKPEVGKGATILLWSDRHAYQVLEVSKDGKRVVIQRCDAKRIDKNPHFSEDQEYDYSKLIGKPETLVYRNGAWRRELQDIFFEDTYVQGTLSNQELFDETGFLKLIPGVTKIQKSFPKVNILWGVQREYYDHTL